MIDRGRPAPSSGSSWRPPPWRPSPPERSSSALSRIDAAGHSTRLDLAPAPYPAYDLIVKGPGLLVYGARAGILLHYSSQGCAEAPAAAGRRLRVTTADGSSADTGFPADLGPCAGSHGSQAEAALLKPLP